MQSLLDEKEYFRLKEYLDIHRRDISDNKGMFFSAFISNAFNQNNASKEAVDTLLKKYFPEFTDSNKIALLRLQRDNYVKAFQYANAAKSDADILKYYQKFHDTAKIADIKNDLIVDSALNKIPPEG